MAAVSKTPVLADADLMFEVSHGGRTYVVTVAGDGRIKASGDLATFNERVRAVRDYAKDQPDQIPAAFRSSKVLYPAGKS